VINGDGSNVMTDEQGGSLEEGGSRRGSDRIGALRALLYDVCAAADARDITRQWGEQASDTAGPLRLACPLDVPFATLAITPWPDETYGVIDIVLRDAPWDPQPLEAVFGPFTETTQLDAGPRRLVAFWDQPELPASALLQVWMGPAGIDALTIRRDPRPATAD
jgi:hypothetical protein